MFVKYSYLLFAKKTGDMRLYHSVFIDQLKLLTKILMKTLNYVYGALYVFRDLPAKYWQMHVVSFDLNTFDSFAGPKWCYTENYHFLKGHIGQIIYLFIFRGY